MRPSFPCPSCFSFFVKRFLFLVCFVVALSSPISTQGKDLSQAIGYQAKVTADGAIFVFPLRPETMKEGFCRGWKPNAWVMVNYEWRVIVRSGKESQSFGYTPMFFWANEALCTEGDFGPVLESAICFKTDYAPLMSCRISADKAMLTITLDWTGRNYKGPIARLLLEQPESVTFEAGPKAPTYYRYGTTGPSLHTISFDVQVEYALSNSTHAYGVCGSGWSTALVPDHVCFNGLGIRTPYEHCGLPAINHKVDFTAACSRHDACYGIRGAAKSDCDAGFYKDLKQACFSQLPDSDSDRMQRACIETALQFNDVVRGQATRRLELWFVSGKVTLPYHVQQAPFTGKSGCNAYLDAQKSAGNTNPNCVTGTDGGDNSW